MKLKLLDISLCRTPVFNHENTMVEKWEELKKLIKDSSPAFYQLIAHVDAEAFKNLDEKIKYTIWKYFNRAKFRATPFGTFAAISLVPVLVDQQSPIILDHALLIHEFNDWKETDKHNLDSMIQIKTSHWFLTNSTIYAVGETIRYLRLKNGVFEIAEVASFAVLNFLLGLCRVKTPPEDIYENLRTEFNLKKSEILDLFVQMVSLQLLLSEKSGNITGEDYFQRMNIADKKSTAPYIIAERHLIAGGLHRNELYNVQETISFLADHLPSVENRQLNKFRKDFLKKFEHRAIPLMTAIDLETGIGYGDLGGHETEFMFADCFNFQRSNEKKELQITYTALHRFLLNQLREGTQIKLDEFISDQSPSTMPLPNTFNVLLHFWNGQPVIENLGGCTANALLGRFTIASVELERFGREISSIEENANPGVLFFDVAYQAEKEVDNVNRRKQLYRFELPILTWSCNSTPLDFDDILVTVKGTEIILWSKKHRKRMVPRIPSAYNYNRSDLAVFRFLCDLQHQGIKSDLNFKLYYMFPNLNRYPRVSYKNVIVSPASWLLPEKLLMAIKSENNAKSAVILREWLQQQGVNFLFKAGHSDQTLCFDPYNGEDIQAFLAYCRQHVQKVIYISEALISDYEVIMGSPAKKHAAQFVISYSHENQIYTPYELIAPKDDNQIARVISLGQEWLYFEIYCHQARANSVLINRISQLLKANKGKIRKWFFIRYEDPLPHIRLRIQLKVISEGYLVISQLKSLLNLEVKSGLVSDIQIKTYFREIDRYGSDRIELVEKVFFQDSKFVLTELATKKSPDELYASTLIMMQHIVAVVFTDLNKQLVFVKQMADSFSKELNLNPISFKKLNQRYRELAKNANLESSTFDKLPNQLVHAYTRVFKTCNITDSSRLMADLFHMHINRLFNADQRSHEAILYQFLFKLLTTRRARSIVLSER